MARHRSELIRVVIAALKGYTASDRGDDSATTTSRAASSDGPPKRFTIVPDDYHVPHAGTAEDGRKFFLSDELFDFGTPKTPGNSYVGLYLWHPDGSFAEVRVDPVPRPEGLPPGQAASAGADKLVNRRLAELGNYRLEPISVEPFIETIDGVKFGWSVNDDDGNYSITIEPGDFIAYYEPWDGLEYDT